MRPEGTQEAALASLARTARVFLIVLIAAAAFWLLADIVLLIFAAVLIAVALRGLSDALSRATGLPQPVSLAGVTLAVVAGIVGLGFWIGPQFVHELGQLGHALNRVADRYGKTDWGRALLAAVHRLEHDRNGFGASASVVARALGGVGSLFLILVTALYLAAAPDLYLDGAIRLVPVERRGRARQIALEVGSVLRWWMLGQLIDMLVVGVLASIGLELLHLPMAMALGVLAGLLTFIPYIGAFIAGIPGVIVAMTVGLPTVVWVIAVYLFCHGVEGYVVSPLVTRRTVHLPPALSVFSMALLGVIYGGLGVVIATPITAAVLVLCHEVYIADMLEDRAGSRMIRVTRRRLRRKREN